MSGIKVRSRRDGKVERWQVDFPVLLPGALRTTRKRYTAPPNITSKSGAVRWAEAMRRELEAGRPVPQSREGRAAAPKVKPAPAPSQPATLAEAVEVYLADLVGRGGAASSVRVQRAYLQHFVEPFGVRPIGEVGEAEASQVRAAMVSAGYAASTINGAVEVLQLLLRRAHVLKLRGPVDRLQRVRGRREKVARAYDGGTYEQIVNAASDPRALAVVLLAGDGALRLGEIVGLEVGDVDRAAGILHVRRSVSGHGEVTPPKGGEERDVPMTARLRAALEPLADDRPRSEPLLAGRSHGGRVARCTVDRWLRAAQAACDLPPKGPHALRHSAATSALQHGADPVAVQKLLGHARLTTTVAMYVHPLGGDAARAVAALERGRAQPEVVTDPSRVPRTTRRKPRAIAQTRKDPADL